MIKCNSIISTKTFMIFLPKKEDNHLGMKVEDIF